MKYEDNCKPAPDTNSGTTPSGSKSGYVSMVENRFEKFLEFNRAINLDQRIAALAQIKEVIAKEEAAIFKEKHEVETIMSYRKLQKLSTAFCEKLTRDESGHRYQCFDDVAKNRASVRALVLQKFLNFVMENV